jgi:pyruvate-ferredoxin/flavodoxin oxidoreductase
VLRGSAQNPDVFFQAREAANSFYNAVPEIVAQTMESFGERTGRSYDLIDYVGSPDAERVLVLMGSGAGAAEEAVERLVERGERVGLLKLRLFRPFPHEALAAALPNSVRAIAVLDRSKEPGAAGEPLYEEIVTALAERSANEGTAMPRVIGGRYGLSSKEFTPAMARAALDELGAEQARNHFTVGIIDDVTGTSLTHDPEFSTEVAETRAIFFGLGSDGTVSANKSSVKIIGEMTDLFAQGYFVYDSKKSGSVTTSHVRAGTRPIRSSYLIEQASFVACHQWTFLERMDVLSRAAEGATLLLNCPHAPAEVWDRLPVEVQRQIIEKRLDLHVIDADAVARAAGMGNRINTVMQPCFFALSGVLPREQAIAAIKQSIEKTYAKRGAKVIERNFAAVDAALEALHRIEVPDSADSSFSRRPPVPAGAPDFVARVTARIMAGEGDLLPVSALPVDGSFPTGTAKWEKRSIAREIPIWDPDICIDCGRCAFYCPHNAIQMKVFEPDALEGAPSKFQSKDFRSKQPAGMSLSIQVAPDDCTGCGVCVDMCPAKSKEQVKHRAINMEPAADHVDRERDNFEFFDAIEWLDPTLLDPNTVKTSQTRQPLFEFSGACAGCGETPYLKLLTQLFGDRILVANATGCSSIYGGNLPTTPWSKNADGRGPAWSNSLFEDNAEFGLGMRLAADHSVAHARRLAAELRAEIGEELVARLLEAEQEDDAQIAAQRARVEQLRQRLGEIDDPIARDLESLAGELVRKSVWIVGGDGWAYDIGSGGLDHTLASGRNVNVLILDTEVYSNTGGQASKATPRGAIAKFAAGGKRSGKKDLGMIATAYGDVYVAQVAIGANPTQTVKAFAEAEQWPGPSLILAYSSCIAHGIDMTKSMSIQDDAVKSGYWPLWRYHPGIEEHQHPLQLDSKEPTIPYSDFARTQARFALLERTDPEAYRRLSELAQADIDERWRLRKQLVDVERTVPHRSEKT